MKKARISVIIPVHNAEKYLAEAIESVINQGIDPMEIIVVDDGSTDNTQKIVEGFGKKLSYIRKENRGPASARNRGLELTSDEFIAFIDADDLWTENKLTWQIARFVEKPQVEIVLGLTKRFLSPEVEIPSGFDIQKDGKTQLTLSVGSGLFKRHVFKKVGLFNKDMLFCEDIDWFLRAIEGNIRISVLEKPVLLYRIHKSNITQDTKKTQYYLLQAFKKSLDRRRKLHPEKPLTLANIRNTESLMAFFNKMHDLTLNN